MSVQRKRHVAKAVTWRLLASLVTFTLGWIFTEDVNKGLMIGIADVIVKLILYYLHERVWYKSSFGVIHEDLKKD